MTTKDTKDTKVDVGGIDPLVVVTTNEERSLPDAFLRRCLVHEMRLPREREALEAWLVKRGSAHFPDLDGEVLREAAEMLWPDRQKCLRERVAPPGGAEYLDLLRIVVERAPGDTGRQLELLGVVKGFVLEKHPLEPRE